MMLEQFSTRQVFRTAWVILLAHATFAAPIVRSAAAPLEKLTIGWSAIAGSQAPFWITKEAGLFEKNGLDAVLELLKR